jgi:hypothetical protein
MPRCDSQFSNSCVQEFLVNSCRCSLLLIMKSFATSNRYTHFFNCKTQQMHPFKHKWKYKKTCSVVVLLLNMFDWMKILPISISNRAHYVTLEKYFSETSLVIFFSKLTHKTKSAKRWETTNSKPPRPIITIGQSVMGSSSHIIFITLFSSRC